GTKIPTTTNLNDIETEWCIGKVYPLIEDSDPVVVQSFRVLACAQRWLLIYFRPNAFCSVSYNFFEYYLEPPKPESDGGDISGYVGAFDAIRNNLGAILLHPH
ncbi:unnamed protein product, partial [Nesidiocoris tenuis]